MAQALYRKWRSQTFDQVVGQEHVITTLRNALRDNRVAHAYLFAGPRGTGKTSIARILAKALNCTAPEGERPCDQCPTCVAITEGRMLDLIEIDAASNNSVDDIRDLRDKVNFRPSEGRFKVYIIDEVHMLSISAFNALLKTLEEPPPHARFMLATTEPHKIPATILSRCQRFDLRRIAVPEIVNHLHYIAKEEGFTAEDEALTAIARGAQGCMRDAISLLDQMLSYGNETVTFQQVQQALGAVSAQAVSGLVDALAERNVAAGLTLIQQLMVEGASLTEFCHQVVEHLRHVMVLQMTGERSFLAELPADTVQQIEQQARQLAQPNTLYAIKRFSAATADLKNSHQPQLPLELALIEAIQGEATAVV
ncbi:MAG: DNA polymerase III subunit gamma/tau, partial [Caldilineaceae bacterium]|nr:DNA polymerase III subunit gamma/tau [Caldilineaceae bacterium]